MLSYGHAGPQRQLTRRIDRKRVRNMKLIISMLILVVVFVVGVGTWKPHAITALMIRLGLRDRVLDNPTTAQG